MLSERVNAVALSTTLRISARAQRLRAEGVDVVDLSAGEPDFPTPEPVTRAAKDALDAGFTKYVASDGIAELKQAIREKLRRDNGLSYEADEILVSPGAKCSLFNATQTLLDPGDEAIVPAPYWVSHPDQVRLAGATPVLVPTREAHGFRLLPEDLRAAIGPRTRAIILNYPSNPTGATYSRAELEALARVCVEADLWVIADEIYEKLLFDGTEFVSIAAIDDAMRARTVVVNGFSKAYSMTGWRLGYAAGPREVISACSKVQSHNTSNATSFVQKAAVTALRECESEVERMRVEFEKRRDAVVGRLASLPGITCVKPQGAFYALPNVASYFARTRDGVPIGDAHGLAAYLLEEARVAVVPGDAFGADEHVRLSFASSMERLDEGLSRIERALEKLGRR